MVISVIVGIVLGIALRSIWSPDERRKLHYLRFPGDLLMNMLKMMIIPLVDNSTASLRNKYSVLCVPFVINTVIFFILE
jgi:Na+/H+-dicarboxylate symporter